MCNLTAAAGVPDMANADYAGAEQPAGRQGCQECKEKNYMWSLERAKFGKG